MVPMPRLQELREKLQMSQRELARRSGLAQSTLIRLENGKAAHPDTIARLAEALGMAAADLIERAGGGQAQGT